jgi:Fe2+ or Zn2+ uptake regulation protein
MQGGILNWILIRNGSELTKMTKESIITKLKEKGLRVTLQRKAMTEVLKDEN